MLQSAINVVCPAKLVIELPFSLAIYSNETAHLNEQFWSEIFNHPTVNVTNLKERIIKGQEERNRQELERARVQMRRDRLEEMRLEREERRMQRQLLSDDVYTERSVSRRNGFNYFNCSIFSINLNIILNQFQM